jgi:hypothetical protein
VLSAAALYRIRQREIARLGLPEFRLTHERSRLLRSRSQTARTQRRQQRKSHLRNHGARLLSPETVVVIFSDGLDVGELDRLERTMRELRARSGGIVWLNPHAGAPHFTPSARGMRTALPHLSALLPARDERDFVSLARTASAKLKKASR